MPKDKKVVKFNHAKINLKRFFCAAAFAAQRSRLWADAGSSGVLSVRCMHYDHAAFSLP
jgi:hypothetical protein